MKIKANAKLKYHEWSLGEELALHVKFKVPNKLFKITRKRTLCDSWWIGREEGYESYEQFQDDIIFWLREKPFVIEEVKKVVNEYISREAKDLVIDDKEKLIKNLLRGNESIEVEVEIESK